MFSRENNQIKDGRYINQNDLDNKTKVVVIGKVVEDDLFLKTNPIMLLSTIL